MFFTCLSAMTGMWLFMTPFLWPEQPVRSGVAALAGLAVMALAPMAVGAPGLARGIAWLGAALGVLNFFLPGDVGSMANFAASGFALILGGMAPMPRTIEVAVESARPADRIITVREAIVPARFAA